MPKPGPAAPFAPPLLVLLGLLAAACQAPGAPTLLPEHAAVQDPGAPPAAGAAEAAAPSYWECRVQDFLDVIPFSVGVGPGLHVGTRLPFLGPALGATWETDRFGWGMSPGAWPRAGQWHEHGELGLLVSSSRSTDGRGYDIAYVPFGPWSNQDGEGGFEWPLSLDVEASVHLGYLGVRAGVSPLQLVDFVLGWFGADLGGDDGPAHARPINRAWQSRPYNQRPDRW